VSGARDIEPPPEPNCNWTTRWKSDGAENAIITMSEHATRWESTLVDESLLQKFAY